MTPRARPLGRHRHVRRDAPGQAAVEIALVLPLVGLLALALLQVALVVRDQILVVHAAREGARHAAVDPSATAARDGAEAAAPLDGRRLDVAAGGRRGPGSRVRVTVRYRSPTDVPLVGALLGDVVVSARATMRVERRRHRARTATIRDKRRAYHRVP